MSIEKALYSAADHRFNPYEISDASMKNTAESVACFLMRYQLGRSGTDYVLGQPPSLSDRLQRKYGHPLGENEKFRSEPAPGFATGFLIGPNLLLTAAHCVCKSNSSELDMQSIQSTLLVFGFQMTAQGSCNTTFPEKDVCKIESVIAWEYKRGSAWADWAVVKLDKDVTHRPPLRLGFSSSTSNQTSVYMHGCPTGLPLKVTTSGVIESSQTTLFTTKLDAFGGNSGSPVFDHNTHEVIGILCEGNRDYQVVQNYSGNGTTRVVTHHVTTSELAQNGPETCQKIASLTFLRATLCSISLPHLTIQPHLNFLGDGLNVEGNCPTPSCGMTLISLGFGTFDMSYTAGHITCSHCQTRIPTANVNTMVLSSCKYTLHGMNTQKEEIQVDFKQTTSYRFDLQTWYFIKITTQPT